MTWVAEEMSLNVSSVKNTRLRFHLVSNDAITRDGFHVDDLKVTITGEGPTSVDTSVDKPGLLAVHPSPADYSGRSSTGTMLPANYGILMIHDARCGRAGDA
ncbi:MAG: hypothetical protein IPL77_10680 [Flavobacteriales bacterium]|nr:hypothetical protein [Flavobacteriales bacterium]